MAANTPFGPDSRLRSSGEHHHDRMDALTRVIDWAESEAAALNAPDAGICLQLARLALMARTSKP